MAKLSRAPYFTSIAAISISIISLMTGILSRSQNSIQRSFRQRTTIIHLPTELILQIASKLPIQSLVILSLTCERLRGILRPQIYRLSQPGNKHAVKWYFYYLTVDLYRRSRERAVYPYHHCIRIYPWPILTNNSPDVQMCPHLLFRGSACDKCLAALIATCRCPPPVRMECILPFY
jgi:hypothetical protein